MVVLVTVAVEELMVVAIEVATINSVVIVVVDDMQAPVVPGLGVAERLEAAVVVL